MVFPKGAAPAHDLSCITWKDGIFFPKTRSFFPGWEVKDGPSQELIGNMMHRPARKNREPDILRPGFSLNLFGRGYSTMNIFNTLYHPALTGCVLGAIGHQYRKLFFH